MAAYTIPPKPAEFTPQGVAPGCRRIPNLYPRDLMGRPVDVLCVHTNWAPGEGSIQSAINWTTAAPGKNTYAHYQHDLNGAAAKMLDSDRRGIGTGGKAYYWEQYNLPTASYRSLTFETADRGTEVDPDPEGSYFTEPQMAALARDLAYECVVHGIPPVLLDRPDGRGIAGHTWPFPYPAFTTASTKKCPGYRKNKQLEEVVIPWTAAIVAAWTAPPPAPEPPEDDDMTDEQIDRIAEAVAQKILTTEINVRHGRQATRAPLIKVWGWNKNQTDELRFP